MRGRLTWLGTLTSAAVGLMLQLRSGTGSAGVGVGQEPAGRNPFVGRSRELAALHDALARARAGQPRTVLLEGPAGIGKSALLRRLVEAVEASTLLDADAAEFEAEVSWAVVDQFVHSAGLPQGALPSSLVRLGPDPPTVGAGLVQLLSRSDADHTILLVVDDVHWADLPSLQALTFALRRLRQDPVLVLLAGRPEMQERLPPGLQQLVAGPRGLRLQLGGLNSADLAELGAALGVSLSDRTAERLRDHTGGIPLHARALLEELTAEQLADPGEVPLPAPRSFAQLTVSRLAEHPPETSQLIEAAAVLGASSDLETVARLGGAGDPFGALDPAVEAGLVTYRRVGRSVLVSFTHALVRAAVYHDLPPGRRAHLHRQAADLVDDQRAALRHRAATVLGCDEGLADDVAEFADVERRAGHWSSAAEAYIRAAGLTDDGGRRDEWLLEAIDAALFAGDRATIEEAMSRLDPGRDSARRRHVLARLALVSSPLQRATELAREAWDLCDPDTDPGLAARIADHAALAALNDGCAVEVLDWAHRSLELSQEPSPDTLLAQVLSANVCAPDEAAEILSHLPEQARDAAPTDVGVLLGRGIVRLWEGDFAGAISDLGAVHDLCAVHGPFHTRYIALFYLADAQFRVGDWDGATANAEIAVSATTDADQPWFAPFVHSAAAFPMAARGEWDAAQRHVEAALAGADARGDMAAQVWAATAEARLAQARNDPQAMLDALERADPYRWSDGGRDPGMQPWILLQCDALLHLNRPGEAHELLSPAEQDEERPAVLLEILRLRGLIHAAGGNRRAARAAFDDGLAIAETATLPFGEALLRMSLGAYLRRAGQRRLAGEHMLAAREAFVRLRASSFLERCERELVGCGLNPRERVGRTARRWDLTPQELAVARLIASGATNREAAAELVVTVKTIEYHLGNIYRKLNVRSRTELALRMQPSADEPTPKRSDPPDEWPPAPAAQHRNRR